MSHSIALTARAAKQIREICVIHPGMAGLRLSVNGGGCSGFQYEFNLTPTIGADDLVIERDGAKLMIDRLSLDFVAGSEIDFVHELMGQAFKVQNPNATASCGCGLSFTI